MYPNYVYRPQRAKDKDGRSKSRKPKSRLDEADGEGVSFVLPMSQPSRHHHHGRSASAPTPPPYQAIQIPNVYQMAPSCPTSPSLLPMIARRSSHPGHEDPMTNFDYVAPSQQFGQFEASLQVRNNPCRRCEVVLTIGLAIRVRTKHVQPTYPSARSISRANAASSATPTYIAEFIGPVFSSFRSLHSDLRPAFALFPVRRIARSLPERRLQFRASQPSRARPPDGDAAAAGVCVVFMGDEHVAWEYRVAPRERL